MTWGVKVSQPGIDVNQAADYQLAFSSEWPTLKILKSQTFTMTDASVKQTIYTHGLGYPPAFMIQTTNTTGRARHAGPGFDEHADAFYVDNNSLVFDPATVGGVTGTYSGKFFIFAYDLTKNYQAPALTVGTLSGSIGPSQSQGIIASVPGAEATSSHPQDLSIDSEARAPLIHSSLNGVVSLRGGADYALIANHSLDYAPLFMAFETVQDGVAGAGNYNAFFGGNGTNIVKTTPTTVEIHTSISYIRGAILVFKDPFFL